MTTPYGAVETDEGRVVVDEGARPVVSEPPEDPPEEP